MQSLQGPHKLKKKKSYKIMSKGRPPIGNYFQLFLIIFKVA